MTVFTAREGDRLITSRYIDRMSVYLHHSDGNLVLIKSPDRKKRIGLKMKFGWTVALIGFYIMFGYNKEWKTVYNPQQEKDGGQE